MAERWFGCNVLADRAGLFFMAPNLTYRHFVYTVRHTTMKPEYDFSKGKRGVMVNREPPPEPGKVKISIRLDEDVLQRFSEMADNAGGKVGYQSLINSALREYLDGKAPRIEEALRRIVREELTRVKVA
jgi:uncharacterized protein (DUF4415 family)